MSDESPKELTTTIKEPKTTKKSKSSKANTSDSKKNPVNKAKDVLNSILGLPTIDTDELISNLLKNTEDDTINNIDFKDIFRSLSSDDKNSDISSVIKHISSLDFITSSSHMERINKYKDFEMILKRIPVIKRILRVYTANILSPDDISKISLNTVPRNLVISKTSEEYISIESKYKAIQDKINLEKHLYNLVMNTLFYGDMFVEILSSKRYLLQTIYDLQIPIEDKNIKLNEEALAKDYEDVDEIAFQDTNYKVTIEWAKPLFEQITETMDFANLYFNAIAQTIGLNEHNLHKMKRNRNYGTLVYLSELFYGNQNILNDRNTFKLFQEDIDELSLNITNLLSTSNSMEVSKDHPVSVDDDTEEDQDKRYALDYLPVQSTLSALTIKIHKPDKIIVLKDEDIDYGYLYVSSGLENVNSMNANASGGPSSISTNSMDSSSVINTSNYLSQNNVRNNLGMFGNGTSPNGGINDAYANQKMSHAKQITTTICQYIKDKFEEYQGNVNINNMSSNLQVLIADILNSGSNTVNIRYIPALNMQQFTIYGTGANQPYGEGVLDDLLFRAKMMLADDINGLINKYMSSGKRLMWTVTANTHQQAADRIQQLMKAAYKKSVSTDNCLDLMASAVLQQDNIFVAKVNGEKQVEIESLDLGSNEDNTNSNTYNIKQLISGVDIPPSHLGYEEWTSGKNTLAVENVVFAQNIIAYQKQFSSMLTELIQKIYVAIYTHTNEFNINYRNLLLVLNSPRNITLSTYAESMNNMNTIIQTMENLGVDKTAIVNMFWPELYDQMIQANNLIKELNKQAKMKEIQSKAGSSKQGEDNGQAPDMMGGGGFGGGMPSFDMGGGGGGDALDNAALNDLANTPGPEGM